MMKVKPVKLGKTERMSFSHIDEVISMPNLIEVQKNSYQWFLDEGLKEVFHDIGTIEDYTGNLALSFVDFRLDKEPKYSIKECKERDVTYAAPLRVTARLLNKETGEVKDQEIFMGDFPLMTDAGTFVINGAERAIVSQLVRSPGVFYGDAKDKVGNDLYSATMNPNRGAWLEYETDASNVFYVRIDKNRKLPVTVLCRALGLSSNEDILNYFGEDERILATLEKDTTKNTEEGLLEVYRKLRPGEPPTVESATSQLNMLFFDPRRYDLSRFGRYKMNKKLSLARRITGYIAAENVVAPLTGELLIEKDAKITRQLAEAADNAGVNIVVLNVEGKKVKVITNGCVDAQGFFSFDVKECGINERCSFEEIKKILDTTSDVEEQKEMLRRNHDQLIGRTVTVTDILSSINYLNGLGHGIGTTDDIDHLGNRRIRSVGELLQNQFRIGFSRMERVIRERMTLQSQDQSVITPQALINIRPVVAAIKEFFGSSPLSQFMDQNNPLAELTHKRRLSALGPGGLSRDRAGFEVRDVHYSHYGRMCPIETPEGPNIGLISYLASYAKINEYGFVEAPYRKVKKTYDEKGRLIDQVVTDEVEYMTADVEDEYVVAQANEPLDETKHFKRARVSARRRDDILEIDAEKVDYMDVSPRMMVSVATACIPFLENDDCNRALMGSNMQRQAVPLMVTQQPIVATGIEHRCAVDSGVVVLAEGEGTVTRVSADSITVRYDSGESKDYKLIKFARSNQGTCINQRPIVAVGDRVTDCGIDTVDVDNFGAAQLVAKHLIDLGHKRIAYLSTALNEHHVSRMRRAEGLQEAYRRWCPEGSVTICSHVNSLEAEITTPDLEYRSGMELAYKCLRNDKITGIVAINDMVAFGVLDALQREGYRVPEDFSLCGFDNVTTSGYQRIQLTTVDNNTFSHGKSAFNLLLERIEGGLNSREDQPINRVEYRSRLIVRGSTGKPRSGGL